MDNMFGSPWLIDELSKLGFSVSYDEIKCYKQSVISNDDSLSAIATRKSDFQGNQTLSNGLRIALITIFQW